MVNMDIVTMEQLEAVGMEVAEWYKGEMMDS